MRMRAERGNKITEQEMRASSKGIPGGEKYNKYGDSPIRRIEIEALGELGTPGESSESKIHKGAVMTDRRFAYTMKRTPLKAGYDKTDAYVGDERRSGARLCVNVSKSTRPQIPRKLRRNYRA